MQGTEQQAERTRRDAEDYEAMYSFTDYRIAESWGRAALNGLLFLTFHIGDETHFPQRHLSRMAEIRIELVAERLRM